MSDPDRREATLRPIFEMSACSVRRSVRWVAIAGASLIFSVSILLNLGLNGCLVSALAVFMLFPTAALFAFGLGQWVASARARRGLAAGPTDATLEQFLQHDLRRIEEYALSSLGINDEELEHKLVLPSPLLWPTEGFHDEFELVRASGDRLYCGGYTVTVLALTAEKVGICRCHLNFLTGEVLRLTGQELRYSEISSVCSTESRRPLALPNCVQDVDIREVVLVGRRGDPIRVPVEIPELWSLQGVDAPPVDPAERAVRVVRSMLHSQAGQRPM